MADEIEHRRIRTGLLADLEGVERLERKYMAFLQEVVSAAAPRIASDFDQTEALLPYWINYAPAQRGRQPTGTSIPWSEVGETVIGPNLIRDILARKRNITFPGLPSGADIRFATEDALIHFDIKLTGPNDNPNEIVASPNQISGDGGAWRGEGIVNSSVKVQGQRSTMPFQPELPPFYVQEGDILLCLTYFLKGVYVVEELGFQPLDYLELVCVPNGLLTFEGPMYFEQQGLFIPGKDDKTTKKKRTRVRLDSLAQVADWRRVKVWSRTNSPTD